MQNPPLVPSGLLLIDKPQGWTSFDVVNKVRGIVASELELPRRRVKVGHSGTLDPMATGLLLLAIGRSTKEIQSFVGLPKSYKAIVTLGASSSTDDAEGEITPKRKAVEPSKKQIFDVLNTFVGVQEQIPPIFSAIKVDGVRAYKHARKGNDIAMKPRSIEIKNITDISYEWPDISFTTEVTSGTYIRSLARDIGASLQTDGYLSALRRQTIGTFSVQNSLPIEGLSYKVIQESLFSA